MRNWMQVNAGGGGGRVALSLTERDPTSRARAVRSQQIDAFLQFT